MTNSRSRRGAVLALALVLALVVPGSALTPPALAAPEIGLSLDGQTFAEQLAMPLFEPGMRWVPGDDETRTFFVRNQGPSGATMTIEALTPGGDPVLESDIALSTRVDGGPWVPLDPTVAATDLTVQPVAVGQVATVDVRAVFDPASTNQTQQRELPLTLRVTLAEAVPGGEDGGSGPDGSDSDGLLPGTGATLGGGTLLLGLLLCLAGAAVIARRGREVDRRG
jgi:hypothetical protein